MSPPLRLPAYAQSKLEEIVHQQGFTHGTYRIDLQAGCKTGDGLIGQIFRATIRGDRQSQLLSLMCKIPLDDREQREQFNSMALFEREVFVYQTVLPEFEKLQLERGLSREDCSGFWSYPKCYWASFNALKQESLLILEDLSERGLEMKDKYIPTDYAHVEVLMIALGKLNACSFALKLHKPDVCEKIKKLDDLLSLAMMTEQTKALAHRNCELAASIFTADHELHLRDKFLSLKDGLWEKTRLLIEGENAEPFAALNHGDCWINNVMYGYDETSGAVNEIVLLDWQMARYSSPVLDFLLYIYLCGEVNLRRDKFQQLLKIFHHSFSSLFAKLGGEPNQSFPFEMIERHMRQFGALALAMGTFAMPIFAKLPNEFFEEGCNKEKYQSQFEDYTKLMKNLVADTELFDDLT